MPTKHVYLSGKAKWARVSTPDPWGNFKVTLYPNPESIEKFKGLGVKNVMKRDEDGDFVVLRCPQQKMIRGKIVAFPPPLVVNKEGNPMRDILIGNGSDVTVKIDHYTYKSPFGEAGKAIRLSGIRVDNLVPYTADRDMEADEERQVGKLDEQPEQLF